MQIEYTNKQPTKDPILFDLKSGDVFRPTGLHNIFMCCDLCGESRLLSELGTEIWGYVTLTGSEPFENKEEFDENYDYEQLVVCVSLITGGVTLLYDGIKVEKIECKLLVEED